MGTVSPQLTILFLLLLFSVVALYFHLRQGKSNAYCHPQPQNKSKENQAPNAYIQ